MAFTAASYVLRLVSPSVLLSHVDSLTQSSTRSPPINKSIRISATHRNMCKLSTTTFLAEFSEREEDAKH